MAKKFRMLVSSTVLVPVSLLVKDDAGKEVQKRATLVCTRLEASKLRERMLDGEAPAANFIREVATGWTVQNLVAEEGSEEPADYCTEALDAMLEVPGFAVAALKSYIKEATAKEKN